MNNKRKIGILITILILVVTFFPNKQPVKRIVPGKILTLNEEFAGTPTSSTHTILFELKGGMKDANGSVRKTEKVAIAGNAIARFSAPFKDENGKELTKEEMAALHVSCNNMNGGVSLVNGTITVTKVMSSGTCTISKNQQQKIILGDKGYNVTLVFVGIKYNGNLSHFVKSTPVSGDDALVPVAGTNIYYRENSVDVNLGSTFQTDDSDQKPFRGTLKGNTTCFYDAYDTAMISNNRITINNLKSDVLCIVDMLDDVYNNVEDTVETFFVEYDNDPNYYSLFIGRCKISKNTEAIGSKYVVICEADIDSADIKPQGYCRAGSVSGTNPTVEKTSSGAKISTKFYLSDLDDLTNAFCKINTVEGYPRLKVNIINGTINGKSNFAKTCTKTYEKGEYACDVYLGTPTGNNDKNSLEMGLDDFDSSNWKKNLTWGCDDAGDMVIETQGNSVSFKGKMYFDNNQEATCYIKFNQNGDTIPQTALTVKMILNQATIDQERNFSGNCFATKKNDNEGGFLYNCKIPVYDSEILDDSGEKVLFNGLTCSNDYGRERLNVTNGNFSSTNQEVTFVTSTSEFSDIICTMNTKTADSNPEVYKLNINLVKGKIKEGSNHLKNIESTYDKDKDSYSFNKTFSVDTSEFGEISSSELEFSCPNEIKPTVSFGTVVNNSLPVSIELKNITSNITCSLNIKSTSETEAELTEGEVTIKVVGGQIKNNTVHTVPFTINKTKDKLTGTFNFKFSDTVVNNANNKKVTADMIDIVCYGIEVEKKATNTNVKYDFYTSTLTLSKPECRISLRVLPKISAVIGDKTIAGTIISGPEVKNNKMLFVGSVTVKTSAKDPNGYDYTFTKDDWYCSSLNSVIPKYDIDLHHGSLIVSDITDDTVCHLSFPNTKLKEVTLTVTGGTFDGKTQETRIIPADSTRTEFINVISDSKLPIGPKSFNASCQPKSDMSVRANIYVNSPHYNVGLYFKDKGTIVIENITGDIDCRVNFSKFEGTIVNYELVNGRQEKTNVSKFTEIYDGIGSNTIIQKIIANTGFLLEAETVTCPQGKYDNNGTITHEFNKIPVDQELACKIVLKKDPGNLNPPSNLDELPKPIIKDEPEKGTNRVLVTLLVDVQSFEANFDFEYKLQGATTTKSWTKGNSFVISNIGKTTVYARVVDKNIKGAVATKDVTISKTGVTTDSPDGTGVSNLPSSSVFICPKDSEKVFINNDTFNYKRFGVFNSPSFVNKSSNIEYFSSYPKFNNPKKGCLIKETIDVNTNLRTIEKGRTYLLSRYKDVGKNSDIMDAILIYNCSPMVNSNCDPTKAETYIIKQVADITYKEIYKKGTAQKDVKYQLANNEYTFNFPAKFSVGSIKINKRIIDLVIEAHKFMESKDNLFKKPEFELEFFKDKNWQKYLLTSKYKNLNPNTEVKHVQILGDLSSLKIDLERNNENGLVINPNASIVSFNKNEKCFEKTLKLEIGYTDYTAPITISYIETDQQRLYADLKPLMNGATSTIMTQDFKVKIGDCK